MKSWKTTVGGVGMILAAVSHIIKDWQATGAFAISTEDMGLIAGGLSLIFARDNNVSSEQAGADTTKQDA